MQKVFDAGEHFNVFTCAYVFEYHIKAPTLHLKRIHFANSSQVKLKAKLAVTSNTALVLRFLRNVITCFSLCKDGVLQCNNLITTPCKSMDSITITSSIYIITNT